MNNNSDHDDFYRRGLLICAVVYTFFFVGAIFGWGPMQLLLEDQGVFECSNQQANELTTTTTTTTCPEQTTRLIQVNLVASATQITAPLWGYVLDHAGAPCLFGLLVMFVVAGILVLISTIALGWSEDVGIYVGFILLALGSWCGGLLMVPVGMYFPDTIMRNRVIIGLNALFDSSAMTFWILWSVQQHSSLDLVQVLVMYLGVAGLVFVPGAYFWYKATPQALVVRSEAAAAVSVESSTTKENCEATRKVQEDITTNDESQHNRGSHVLHTVLEDTNDRVVVVQKDKDYVLVSQRTSRQQLVAYPTLLLFFFFGIQVATNLWTLTTTRDFLAHLGDDALGNRYLTIFTLLTPVSLIGTPAVDWALRKWGFPMAFQFINLLSLGSMIIRVSSTNLNVQIVGFVLFSLYRSFLFGITFSYIPTLLSSDLVGRMAGLLYMISGVASFLNIPMARLAIQRHEGDFFKTNVVYTLFIVPCILAWVVRIGWNDERFKKEFLKDESATISEKVSLVPSSKCIACIAPGAILHKCKALEGGQPIDHNSRLKVGYEKCYVKQFKMLELYFFFGLDLALRLFSACLSLACNADVARGSFFLSTGFGFPNKIPLTMVR